MNKTIMLSTQAKRTELVLLVFTVLLAVHCGCRENTVRATLWRPSTVELN
jgi:hypothetical protein